MLNVIFKGGPTMIPLLICSVLSLAIMIERYIYLRRLNNNDFRLVKKIKLLLSNGKISKAKQEAKQAKGPVAAMLVTGLENYGESRQAVKEFVQSRGQSEIKAMEKRLRILDFIATVAPLLGILGTVLGIINSFNILAGAQGIAAPSALSVGIAEALISTATGLIVAIPSMLFYTYLDSKVEAKTDEMNRWAAKLVELLSTGTESSNSSRSQIRGDKYVSKKY